MLKNNLYWADGTASPAYNQEEGFFHASVILTMTANLCAVCKWDRNPFFHGSQIPKCHISGLCKTQILTRLSLEKTDFAVPLKEIMDTVDHIQSHLHIDLIISKYVIMNNVSFYPNREFNILWIFLGNFEEVS